MAGKKLEENNTDKQTGNTDNEGLNSPEKENKRIRFSSLLSKKEFIIVLAFFAILLSVLVYTFFSPNYYSHKAPLKFEIAEGASLKEVIDSLYKYQVIPNRTNMRIAAFVFGADKKIKAGRYKIPNGLSYISLLQLLIKGEREIPQLVTFQEGLTITQFAHILHNKIHADSAEVVNLCSDSAFIHSLGLSVPSLEGYLLPDSYRIYDNTPPEKSYKETEK